MVAGVGDHLDDGQQRGPRAQGQLLGRRRVGGRGRTCAGELSIAFFDLENMGRDGRSRRPAGGDGHRRRPVVASVRSMPARRACVGHRSLDYGAGMPETPDRTELRYELADGIARLTIDRPERRNALSWAVLTELRSRLAEIKADPTPAWW